jgi:predicted aminopeptidase
MLTCAALAPGCMCRYAVSAVLGELDLLANAESIDDALAGDELTEDQKQRLRYAVRVRDYASEEIGLHVGNSYSTFYNTGGGPVAYNLSACPPDELEPVTWTFPIAGTFEYLGFFDRTQAEAYRDAVIDAGYDIFFYEVDAYSTINIVPDPIYSSMLERDDISLAEVVFHELTHNTVFSGDVVFNESIATFVQRAAGLRFLADTYGEDAEIVDRARLRHADEDLFTEWIDQLYDELRALYGSKLSREAKLIEREDIIEQARTRFADEYLPLLFEPDSYGGVLNAEINNAVVLAYRRYHSGFDAYQEAFEELDNSFPRLLSLFTEASQATRPSAFIEEWLSERP